MNMMDFEKHDARNKRWEYALPYHIFVSHEYDVDFVSPLGEKPIYDELARHKSLYH